MTATAVVVCLAACSGPAAPTAAPATGSVQILRVPSADTDVAVREVRVYRPSVPDTADLPVLYFLHGLPGGTSDLFEAGVVKAMAAFVAAGGTPFVVAAPDGNGRAHDDTEWADSVDRADLVETFVTRDVVRAVEGVHLRTRERRAIAGFSMGGFGAANLALRHPDLYGQLVAIDGYFHIDDPDRVFGRHADVEAANSPDQHADGARRLRSLLVAGASDPDPLTHGESDRFGALLDRVGADHRLVTAVGGHDLGFLSAQLPVMARFLGEGWAPRRLSAEPPGP